MRPLVRLLYLVCACLALLVSPSASAQVGGGTGPMPRRFPHAPPPPPSPGGPSRIRLTTADGDRGPVTLQPKNGGFIGEFVVWNDGQGALNVSRVAVRTDDDDPRLPPRFNARFSDGGGGSSIVQPHSSKRVTITWVPEREPKLHQAVGQVVLTSNDETSGEVAMGFVAPLSGPVSGHLLTWLLLLPLLTAAAAGAMHIVGYAEDGRLRGLALASSGLQCLLAVVLYQGFNGAVTRIDGNDGYQYVERASLFGAAEYYVGVDGTSVSLVILTAVVGLSVAIGSFSVDLKGAKGSLKAYYGWLFLLVAALTGVFVAVDLALLLGCWVVMLGSMVALVAVTTPKGQPWPWRLAVYGGVSAVALGFAVMSLHLNSDPTFLVDGTRTQHSFAIPELMRVAYNAKGLTLFGASFVKVVWTALFVAFAVLIPLVPAHRWLTHTVADAPGPVAALITGVVVKTGIYGLLRVSIDVLPDGSRWAANTLAALGVITIALAAVAALRETDLRRVIAYAAVGELGFAVLGVGAMTREGLLGCLLQMTTHGVVVAGLFLALGGANRRAGGTELGQLRGLGRRAPLLATALAGGLLALAGTPGLAGFWGPIVALLGAFPVQRVLTLIAATAGVALAASLARTVRGLFGVRDGEGATEPDDLRAREVTALAPLVVLAIGLGVAPAPFFALVQGGALDENQLVNPAGPDEIALVETSPHPPDA